MTYNFRDVWMNKDRAILHLPLGDRAQDNARTARSFLPVWGGNRVLGVWLLVYIAWVKTALGHRLLTRW